jgi:uncharacterized protein
MRSNMSALFTWFMDTQPPQPVRVDVTRAPFAAALPARALAPALQDFVVAAPGTQGALLISTDGREIASAQRRPLPTGPLAAMASTLLAVGGVILTESGAGPCRHVLVESDRGWFLAMGVGDPGGRLLLGALIDSSAMLGQVLWAARRCCAQLRLDMTQAVA